MSERRGPAGPNSDGAEEPDRLGHPADPPDLDARDGDDDWEGADAGGAADDGPTGGSGTNPGVAPSGPSADRSRRTTAEQSRADSISGRLSAARAVAAAASPASPVADGAEAGGGESPAAVPRRVSAATAAVAPGAGAPTAGAPAEPERRRRRRDTLRGVAVQSRPGLRQRVRAIVRDAAANDSARRRVAVPMFALRVIVQVVRQWARDRCPQQAASLAFQTVLSIVPLLALSLATLRMGGEIDAQSALVKFLANTLIPVSPDEIAETLVKWSENVTVKTLGAIGLLTTVVLAFVMFNTLERIINDIWRAERRRSFWQKFVVFYVVVTLLPLLLGTLLFQASRYDITTGITGFLASFGTMWLGGLLVIFVLPKAEVKLRSAVAGALVSALLFELAKGLFHEYAERIAFAKYSGIYGAVAIAPIVLVWIYYSWLVLLLGAEVAYAAQYLHLLERRQRRQTMSLERELVTRVNGVVAARLMVAIAEAYLTGKKVISRGALCDRFDLSVEVVDRIATRLKENDLAIEVAGELVGLMPSRAPAEISLADVLAAFRGDDVLDTLPHPSDTRLDNVLRDIERDALDRTRNLYLDELL